MATKPSGGDQPGSAGSRRTPGTLLLPGALLVAALLDRIVLPPDLDVDVYRKYAHAIIRGPLSVGLPHEYPALAGALFVLPHYLVLSYAAGFSLLMTGGFVALMWAGRTFGEAWARRTVLYLTLSVFGILLFRFDLLVAVTIVLSVRAGGQSNWGSAWAWAVLGGFLKLTPFLLLPGLAIAERRESGSWPLRRVLTAGAIGLAASLIQLLLAPGTLLSPLSYEIRRGFEYASVPGTITLLTSPRHLYWIFRFGNIEVVGGYHSAIAIGTMALAVVGMVGVWVLAYRRLLPVSAVSLAVLTIAILTNKSFAPQYLMWLAPLWAFWGVRPAWVACAALTSLVYPMILLIAQHAGWRHPFLLITIVAALRNLALLAGSAGWLWSELKRARTTRAAIEAGRRMAGDGPSGTLDRVAAPTTIDACLPLV